MKKTLTLTRKPKPTLTLTRKTPVVIPKGKNPKRIAYGKK